MASIICTSCGGENPTSMRFCGHCGGALGDSAVAPAADAATTEDPREGDVARALKSLISAQVADRIEQEGGKPAEERRLVTALFADLSGFTPLADRLDPEELLDVIDPIINRLTQVVGRYEGYVDKFAGDALLAFFGAPTAHEDDAERAVLVALEMHAELKRTLPELPEHARDLTLHVGVNTGHVIARVLGTEVKMDYSVLGDAVILAQRLESAAPPGATYVGSVTHYLTQDRFEFEPVGELTLKGKKEPVTAWNLLGRKASAARTTSPRFVGRTKELETARLVLDGLATGSGAVISVSGEPGVGKTRLTSEIHEQASEHGVRWLTGRSLSYGSAIAYWPFADLFRSFFRLRTEDPHDAALERLQAELEDLGYVEGVPYISRLLGLPAPEIGALDPETYRRRLHRSATDLFTLLAAQRPLVIAIEDLHWGDPSSVALITDIAPLCASHPLVLYLTARVEAVPVLVEIAAHAPEMMRHVFRLERFMHDEIEDLVTALLGRDAPAEVVAAIAERSAGNPFFAEELVRAMQDAGQLVRAEGRWKTSHIDAATLPPTVEGVLSSRIDLLPRRAATVLQDASVIGRRVRIPILKELEGDSADLDTELALLIDRAYVEPSDRPDELVFHHALVQEAAYARLLRRQKKKLHRRVAEIAEALYGSDGDVIDLLARHLYLGQAGAKAVEYLVRAGERSKALFANEEAILHFSRAAELARTEQGGRRGLDDILLQLGDLHELRGQYEAAMTLYTEVRDESGDVRAWRGLASSLRNQGAFEEALQVVDQALASNSRRPEDLATLWLERGWILIRRGHFPEAVESLEKGLAQAPEHDPLRGELLVQLAGAETATRELEQALEHGLAAATVFEALDHVRGLTSAMRILGDTYREMKRLDDAARVLRRGLELAERIGSIEEIAGTLINLGIVEQWRGDLDAAIECDLRAIEEFERIDHSTGKAVGYGNLAEKLMYAERYEEATLYSGKSLEIARAIGQGPTIADVLSTEAAIYRSTGDLVRAAEVAEEAARVHLEMGVPQLAIESLTLAANALNEAGQQERALELLTRARSLGTD